MTNKRFFGFKETLMLVIILGLSATASVFGADRYRVSASVFHLGELIAQPVLDVEAGKTIGGTYSVPGKAQYTFVVLVQPASDGEVYVSMQFSSGNIDIQPNLLVTIGEETSATIDKVRLTLLVQDLAASIEVESNERRLVNPLMEYRPYTPAAGDLRISRQAYVDKLHGFWLGQCIANWTGLVTEMDKIGGEGAHGKFYTREDWGQPDQANIWSDAPSPLSATIDWVLEDENGMWGADDDTDIEYIYQHLLLEHQTSLLSGEQIRDGWLKHIYSEENTPFTNSDGSKENFLWVSNQRAFDLMTTRSLVPPATSDPDNNPDYDMIDAQLTTEIFGLFAPARPDVALKMAHLPIRTTAYQNAAWASEFYVVMYSLASLVDPNLPVKEQIMWMADHARQRLPADAYSAKMFDFVKSRYLAGVPWEQARDEVYVRYQVEQGDGYDITSRNMDCNGCFASGINFASSIVSLLYGEGDYKETVKIAVLAGWDSDNPAATWGGLLGFMHGKEGIEQAFGRKFADRFNIHRTRGGFPNDGIDSIRSMAEKGVFVVDRAVQEAMGGGVDLVNDQWFIPAGGIMIAADSSNMGEPLTE